MQRLVATIIIALSVIFLPWWIYLPLLGGGLIYFQFYWEGLILAFIIDALYGTRSLQGSMAVYALIILLILVPLRGRIRFHA